MSECLSARRLVRAASRVRDNWFPVQQGPLRNFLRSHLQHDSLPQLDELVTFIKNDLSLYLFSVLRLSAALDAVHEKPAVLSLRSLIERVGIREVMDILNIEGLHCSRLSFNDATGTATDRLQEAAIAAVVTESCARVHDLNSEEAYLAAVLRQLGIILIAWNYPGLYEEALLQHPDPTACSTWLESELGFAPRDLALQVCSSWISDESDISFRQYLDDQEFRACNEELFHLCSLGEVLGHACFPQYYRANDHDLAEAFTQLDILGGPLLISQVQIAFQEIMEALYDAASEAPFPRRTIQLAEHWKPRRDSYSSQFARNLSDFSALLRYEKETRRLVHLFLSELVPSAGFSSAAIYSYVPEEIKLVRRASFGELAPGIEYEIVCETFAGDPGFIELAFESSRTLVQFSTGSNGQPVTGCAVSFGGSDRFGVLYLEFPDILADVESETLVLKQATALKRVLEDALIVAYM